MPRLIERQIESDEYGYYCIDTYLGYENFPLVGYGYTEEQAVSDAEKQARRCFNDIN